jgi:type 1 glutamine amidotransferase
MKLLPAIALALAATSAFAAEAKRVLVVTVTAGFRHSSIPFAEKTLQKLADESNGAFQIVGYCQQPDIQVPQAPRKPKDLDANADEGAKKRYANDMKKYDEAMARWTPEVQADAKAKQQALKDGQAKALARLSPASLAADKIDGVIFANTTGPLPLPDRDGFIKWIEEGHAFMGMHSSSDTLHPKDVEGWTGYRDMLQGEFRTHGKQVPADLIAGDQAHPANAGIGAKWDLKQEEMYEMTEGSHDRSKVRALSWNRKAGKGNVFYTSLGHREDLWSDDPAMNGRINPVETAKQYQAHVLGGIKWALGLAEGSSEPNPEVK